MALAFATVLGLFACGGGGGGDDDGDNGDADGAGDAGEDGGDQGDGGAPDPVFGEPENLITVSEVETRWRESRPYSTASAALTEVAGGFLVEKMREGSCRLLESDVEFCPDCAGLCVEGECRPWPTYRSAGRITLSGLAEPVSLTWSAGSYFQDRNPLPGDVFAPGDSIAASAPGDEVESFSVETRGVATIAPALEGECESELRVGDGDAAEMTWPNPAAGARVRLWLPSRNDGHGLPPRVAIECEGPDTGSMRIPAAIVSGFPVESAEFPFCDGIACAGYDCPPATITRYSQGEASAGAETVVLRVQSELFFHLVHTSR